MQKPWNGDLSDSGSVLFGRYVEPLLVDPEPASDDYPDTEFRMTYGAFSTMEIRHV